MTNNRQNIIEDSRELSILASLYGLSFMLIDKKTNDHTYFEYAFEMTHPEDLEEKLKSIIQERAVLQRKFEKVNIIHHNSLFTNIPKEVFDKTLLQTYLDYNVKLLPTDFIDYDYIGKFDLYNIYVPFVNINNTFLNTNKQVHYAHSSGMFMKKIGKIRKKQKQLPVFDIYINVFAKDFQILVFHNEQIVLINQFEYDTVDDFLYFLFFAIESLEIKDSKAKYHIGGVDTNHIIIKNLLDFNPKLDIIISEYHSKINNFF